MSLSDIAVIVVAAGRGSRMQELTADKPKSLIPFAGRPLIEWQLSALAENGLDDITIVTGYRAEQLEKYGTRTVKNPDWDKTNMVHSLFCAREVLHSGRPVLVIYADIIYEPRVPAELLYSGADAVTVVDFNWQDLWKLRLEDPLQDAETLRLSETGTILEIGQKPNSLDEIEGQYIGMSRFSPEGARKFENVYRDIETYVPGKTSADCYFTDVLQGMILAGDELKAAIIHGGWLEFDSAADLSAYRSSQKDGSLQRFWLPKREATA